MKRLHDRPSVLSHAVLALSVTLASAGTAYVVATVTTDKFDYREEIVTLPGSVRYETRELLDGWEMVNRHPARLGLVPRIEVRCELEVESILEYLREKDYLTWSQWMRPARAHAPQAKVLGAIITGGLAGALAFAIGRRWLTRRWVKVIYNVTLTFSAQ